MTHGIEQNGTRSIHRWLNTTLRELFPFLHGNLCFVLDLTSFSELDLSLHRLVYHVHKQNYTGFIEALRTASTTEIPSFIPEYLTEHAMRERIRYLMEHDWKEEATVLLEERIKEGTGYMFDI